MQKISLILITYKSENIIFDFIKKIPKEIKTIIIENSNNIMMKEEIEKKYFDFQFHQLIFYIY